MGRIKEPLNRGLSDGPDPATLEPGELSDLQNVIYRPSSQALQRASGWVGYATATAAASDVAGLRDVQFDNGDHFLIGYISGAVPAYVTSVVSAAGFGILTTAVTAGASGLERAHWTNQFYLFNGTTAVSPAASGTTALPNTNTIVYLSSTAAGQTPLIRQHGMLPVTATPNYSTAAGTFALTVTGYYEYWTTEVAKLTVNGSEYAIESTFAGSPATVNVASTATVPTIQMPDRQNGITTHWRVYRSPKKEQATDKAFPDGFLIGEQSIASAGASAGFSDTQSVSSTGPKFATAFGTGSVFADFGSGATAMSAVGGTTATAVVPTAYGPQQSLYGFDFGAFKGAVVGVEVKVTAYVTAGGGPIQLGCTIGRRDTDGRFTRWGAWGGITPRAAGKSSLVLSTSPSSPSTLSYGGSTDRWLPTNYPAFTDTDFDGNFMVLLGATHPGTGSMTLGVDAVSVNVYYGGSNVGAVQFPTVVYTFGDISAEVGKNGPPPSSRTGDVFEGCLVVNDESNPSIIRYSAPEQPEYFPATYFVDVETPANDRVQAIKVVNNRLIVGLDNAVYRVNYLPSERDASFDRGKAIDPISQSLGVLNPMCICTFSPDAETQILAWVSRKGIHMTDGFNLRTLTNNLNWRAILSTSAGAKAIALVDDPENQNLVFYYYNPDLAANYRYRALHLSYAAQHLGPDGRLKISGKVLMRNKTGANYGDLKSAWSVPRSNGDTTVFLGYGGHLAAGAGVVYQVSGSTLPVGDPNFSYTTRRMYLAGEAYEFRANEVYGYLGSYTSAGGALGIDMTCLTVKTNDDLGEVTAASGTVGYAGRKLGKWQFRQAAEGLRLVATVTGNPDNAVAWEYLVIDGEGFGVEDSGL